MSLRLNLSSSVSAFLFWRVPAIYFTMRLKGRNFRRILGGETERQAVAGIFSTRIVEAPSHAIGPCWRVIKTTFVNDERIWPKLYEAVGFEGVSDGREVGVDALEQGIVCDVSGGHNEETSRLAAQQAAVAEVCVLRDDDPTLCVRDGDLAVG